MAALELGQQRLKVRLVAAPARDGVMVQRPPDLNVAGRSDQPVGFVEAQAAIIPGQTATIDQPSGLLLQLSTASYETSSMAPAGRINRQCAINSWYLR